MIKEHLPTKVDPFRFADNYTILQGSLLIKDMDRLASSLASSEGVVETSMTFGIDEQGIRYIKGDYQSTLILQCQRCMDSFDYDIISNFNLGIVQSEEEADKLPAHYDAIVIKEGELVLRDMIEDELIVNLPIVPMHSPAECKVNLPLITEIESVEEAEKDNPFKVIEQLRVKRDSNK